MLTITMTTAAAAALLNIWLAIRTVRRRSEAKVMNGDGNDDLLRTRMRAQSNFVENAPFVLILLGLIEYARGPEPWLWAAGIIFLVGRILHPFGLERNTANPLRAAGILSTWVVTLGLAAYAIVLTYTHAH